MSNYVSKHYEKKARELDRALAGVGVALVLMLVAVVAAAVWTPWVLLGIELFVLVAVMPYIVVQVWKIVKR